VNAIDTNVLVRLLVADDMTQAQQAAALIDSGQAFLSRLRWCWSLNGS